MAHHDRRPYSAPDVHDEQSAVNHFHGREITVLNSAAPALDGMTSYASAFKPHQLEARHARQAPPLHVDSKLV